MIIGALGMAHKSLEGRLKHIVIKEEFHHITESLFAGDSKDLEIVLNTRGKGI